MRLFSLVNWGDGQHRWGGPGSDLVWCRSCRGRDVLESVEEGVEGGVPVVDSGAFLVGEWDLGAHALQVVLGFEQLGLGGVFRGVEIATGAGYPVRALLEEAVCADQSSSLAATMPRNCVFAASLLGFGRRARSNAAASATSARYARGHRRGRSPATPSTTVDRGARRSTERTGRPRSHARYPHARPGSDDRPCAAEEPAGSRRLTQEPPDPGHRLTQRALHLTTAHHHATSPRSAPAA